ncbi:MAG: hypothetical protein J7K98_03290 [Candidatus Aenigmarchaeota archaeon]|nr:hypothetical protein [Candidatus Aenigmarchaeota archaeon]
MKSQVSVEYVLILGVAFLILIPFILQGNISLEYLKDSMRVSFTKNSVESLGQAADMVFSQGPPAKIVQRVYIPKGIEEILIHDHEINFRVILSNGETTDVYYITKGNVIGSLPTSPGYYKASIYFNGSLVVIGVVE